MPKKAKNIRKRTESKMSMKTMPMPPQSTSPNSADTEIKKLMSHKGYPRKKAR